MLQRSDPGRFETGAGWAHTNVIEGGFAAGINQFGFVAAGDLNTKFYGNWIARAEYLHYDFDNTKSVFSLVTDKVDVVRGGLSYRF
jgi:hypothetical protein